jgi:hypothetical protein
MFRLTTVLSGTGVVHGSPHRVGAKADFVADEELPSFRDRHTRYSTEERRKPKKITLLSILILFFSFYLGANNSFPPISLPVSLFSFIASTNKLNTSLFLAL